MLSRHWWDPFQFLDGAGSCPVFCVFHLFQTVADVSQIDLFDRIQEEQSHWHKTHKTNQRLRTVFPDVPRICVQKCYASGWLRAGVRSRSLLHGIGIGHLWSFVTFRVILRSWPFAVIVILRVLHVLHGRSMSVHIWSMQIMEKGRRRMLLDLLDYFDWRCLNSIIDLQVCLFNAESILMTAWTALGRSGKLSFIIMSFMCFKVLHVLRMSGNLACDRIKEHHSHWHKTNQSLRTVFAASLYGQVLC